MSKIKKFLSTILEFIAVVFVYEEETYNKFMNKVDNLRRKKQ